MSECDEKHKVPGARGEAGKRTGPSTSRIDALWRAIRPPWRRPKAKRLYLEVTNRCNLNCPSCYKNTGPEAPDALTLQEQKSVVSQARRMGARVVSLSGGGEPLLYKDIFALIDYVRALGMDVVIFTNGTPVTKEAAEGLMSGDVVVYFQLPALTTEVSDRMAGKPNAHEWVEFAYQHDGRTKRVRIPRGLKNLLELRTTERTRSLVKLEALITRINHRSLPEVAAFSKELGLGLHLETPVFSGRAIENYRDLALDAREYSELYERLLDILGEDYFESHRSQRCPVERNPVVWTNGDVAFCSSRSAAVGNVRNAPLRKLFARAKKLKRKEDRRIARRGRGSRYFHTCRARQYFEARHGLPCEY